MDILVLAQEEDVAGGIGGGDDPVKGTWVQDGAWPR